MGARTYSCSACGGQVDELARRCKYCAAPVATVRCSTCFNMNVPEAAFCSGCGRQAGLEPVGEAGALPCPLCKQAMQVFRDGPGMLFDCSACAGQFVEHAMFREMLHRHHELVDDSAVKLPRRADPRSTYIPCPECAVLMNRKNFGGTSGVVVDVCKKHGTWFDEGELPRVLSFVVSGGLERARQREVEEAQRSKRDAAVSARGSVIQASQGYSDHTPPQSVTPKAIVDFLLHLLD